MLQRVTNCRKLVRIVQICVFVIFCLLLTKTSVFNAKLFKLYSVIKVYASHTKHAGGPRIENPCDVLLGSEIDVVQYDSMKISV